MSTDLDAKIDAVAAKVDAFPKQGLTESDVVHSAHQRALRAPASSSRRKAMQIAPTIGRKVMRDRIGQLVISAAPRRT
jgi:protein required for attachment to host cells